MNINVQLINWNSISYISNLRITNKNSIYKLKSNLQVEVQFYLQFANHEQKFHLEIETSIYPLKFIFTYLQLAANKFASRNIIYKLKFNSRLYHSLWCTRKIHRAVRSSFFQIKTRSQMKWRALRGASPREYRLAFRISIWNVRTRNPNKTLVARSRAYVPAFSRVRALATSCCRERGERRRRRARSYIF